MSKTEKKPLVCILDVMVKDKAVSYTRNQGYLQEDLLQFRCRFCFPDER